MSRTAGTTRTESVYGRLRADILGGRLVPGQRLKFPELPQHYASSVGATREALTRLAGEGLVRSQPNQGYTVTPLSHEDLADLTLARVEVESRVLWLSVLHGDLQWEAQAVAAHHLLERTPYRNRSDPDHPSDEWSEAHAAFHRALLAGCPNRRLLSTARGLREEAELYLHWSVSFGHEPDRDVASEHRALVEAATARDADRAAELLRDHIAHTAQLVIRGAPDEPNPSRTA
ncbi:GntR family transcriptional regulator [Amycolatopsis jiangsuensis]|uniref:DNA-binding GntR family transcriptional regulator n=1 Tax=Amycolatopsis jiangsuensis TaxID=1181879 RepID=A0A840IKU2_9PSEU|nr:FCD domain-containing protein [Amycolatopsis jiangsuensis]MBB4682610.1 DNA-binding GntR family transcriptional regulator [Amycolatopsis jiangsuensis]